MRVCLIFIVGGIDEFFGFRFVVLDRVFKEMSVFFGVVREEVSAEKRVRLSVRVCIDERGYRKQKLT